MNFIAFKVRKSNRGMCSGMVCILDVTTAVVPLSGGTYNMLVE